MDGTADEELDALPIRLITPNQLVGYNLRYFRRAAGLTQEEFGRRLGGWSKVVVSSAERSWRGGRVRQFDADELAAITVALGIPLIAMFLPPEDNGVAARYVLQAEGLPKAEEQPSNLFRLISPPFEEFEGDESPAMRAFTQRRVGLAPRHREPRWEDEMEAAEMEAAAEYTRNNARVRAEKMEVEALERRAMEQLEQLERRVDTLRAFERAYRQRMRAILLDTRNEVTGFLMAKFAELGPESDDPDNGPPPEWLVHWLEQGDKP